MLGCAVGLVACFLPNRAPDDGLSELDDCPARAAHRATIPQKKGPKHFTWVNTPTEYHSLVDPEDVMDVPLLRQQHPVVHQQRPRLASRVRRLSARERGSQKKGIVSRNTITRVFEIGTPLSTSSADESFAESTYDDRLSEPHSAAGANNGIYDVCKSITKDSLDTMIPSTSGDESNQSDGSVQEFWLEACVVPAPVWKHATLSYEPACSVSCTPRTSVYETSGEQYKLHILFHCVPGYLFKLNAFFGSVDFVVGDGPCV
jgi:hypothetical protein